MRSPASATGRIKRMTREGDLERSKKGVGDSPARLNGRQGCSTRGQTFFSGRQGSQVRHRVDSQVNWARRASSHRTAPGTLYGTAFPVARFMPRIAVDALADHLIVDLEGFHRYKIVYIRFLAR
jgi:hypothetical protein